jgi:hypothetical protein
LYTNFIKELNNLSKAVGYRGDLLKDIEALCLKNLSTTAEQIRILPLPSYLTPSCWQKLSAYIERGLSAGQIIMVRGIYFLVNLDFLHKFSL